MFANCLGILRRTFLPALATQASSGWMNWRSQNETHDTDCSEYFGGFGRRVRASARPGLYRQGVERRTGKFEGCGHRHPVEARLHLRHVEEGHQPPGLL